MRGLQRRVMRLERAHTPHQHLLQWANIPIEQWPEPLWAEFAESTRDGTANVVLRALSQANLEWLIENLEAVGQDSREHHNEIE